MQRALNLLNPYGREAGQHKLKNGLKTQKMHFLRVFELTLASLTAIWVEQNLCPLRLSILLTQGPIDEIIFLYLINNYQVGSQSRSNGCSTMENFIINVP